MPSNVKYHQLLLRAQVRVASVGISVMIVVAAVAGLSQIAAHNRAMKQAQVASQQAHFYRIIAGQEQDNLASLDNVLGVQLQQRLGPIDPQATGLPSAITDYHGSTNLYGGITNVLGGLDPFVESPGACQECGPLTSAMQNDLLRIKRGDVEGLIRDKMPPAVTNGYTLTPFGLSGLETGGLVWLLGGPLTLLAAYRWLRGNQYSPRHFGDLDWRFNEDAAYGAKFGSMLMAASFFVPYRFYKHLTRRQFERKVRERFGSQMDAVDQTDRYLDKVSLTHGDDPNVQALRKYRDTVVSELESHTRAGSNSIAAESARLMQRLEDANERTELAVGVIRNPEELER